LDGREIETWIRDWQLRWGVSDLADRVRIEPGPRLRRALGRCHAARGLIRIHPALFEEPEAFLREVVCHELAHVAVHRLHGSAPRPHGREWAALMRAAGYEPRARVPVSQLPAAMRVATTPRRRWCHTCPVCGATRTAGRPVYRWHCRPCWEAGLGGRLEIRRVG